MIHLAAKIVAGEGMVNRRSVLKIGAVTAAGVLVKTPVSGRNQSRAQAHIAIHRAVFDERFAECRAFEAELLSAGVFTSAIRGDVAQLWYGDLRVHLAQNRLPFAGLTDRAALFCLEELARDVSMRVLFRADHIIDQNGDPTGHTAEFGRAIARMFSQFDISGCRDTSAQKRTGPFSPENKTALVGWVIG
jgi:hypothetical protein